MQGYEIRFIQCALARITADNGRGVHLINQTVVLAVSSDGNGPECVLAGHDHGALIDRE